MSSQATRRLSVRRSQRRPAAMSASTGKYASVNGLQVYYEVHGEGRPLVLLHGGVTTIELTFGDLVALLAQLDIDQADFFGLSLGALVSFTIAIRYPDVVHKLVLASANYRPE